MDPRRKTDILKNCSFLSGAGDDILSALSNECAMHSVEAGSTILRKGDHGSTMYFIAEGSVRVHDDEVVLARLQAGEVFGEMAVLDADVRSASITAEEDSTLLSLERDDLWRVISTSTEALKTIIAAVLQRERGIVHDVTQRAQQLMAYEKELEIGRRIQADFLPERMPQVEHWEIASCFEAAREVAGDFFDAFELKPSRRLAIVIGDVCDKGVGAALFMTLFRSLIRASCQYGVLGGAGSADKEPDSDTVRQILQHSIDLTNRYIATTHSRSSMFASVFFGVLDPDDGELYYVNGGHESPMVFRADGSLDVLEVTGGVLGLFPFAQFSVATTRLHAGDLLYSYTDGVNEAKNEQGEQFGEERIVAAASDARDKAGELLQSVLRHILEFRGAAAQSDDITMLAVRRLENG